MIGDIVLEGRFSTTGGIILVWHMKGEESITGLELPKVHII